MWDSRENSISFLMCCLHGTLSVVAGIFLVEGFMTKNFLMCLLSGAYLIVVIAYASLEADDIPWD